MVQKVVIVAGGSGSRMKASVPKQFLLLAGEPILVHTVRRFATALPEAELVVVLPELEMPTWLNILDTYPRIPSHKLAIGGKSRSISVKNGLAALTPSNEATVVAVHDGVRPLVAASAIQHVVTVAKETGAAALAVPSKDSLREQDIFGNRAIDRSKVWQMQTPQVFWLKTLQRAFNLDGPEATDEATLVERIGVTTVLVEGSYSNIKITTPEDLLIAEALLQHQELSLVTSR